MTVQSIWISPRESCETIQVCNINLDFTISPRTFHRHQLCAFNAISWNIQLLVRWMILVNLIRCPILFFQTSQFFLVFFFNFIDVFCFSFCFASYTIQMPLLCFSYSINAIHSVSRAFHDWLAIIETFNERFYAGIIRK